MGRRRPPVPQAGVHYLLARSQARAGRFRRVRQTLAPTVCGVAALVIAYVGLAAILGFEEFDPLELSSRTWVTVYEYTESGPPRLVRGWWYVPKGEFWWRLSQGGGATLLGLWAGRRTKARWWSIAGLVACLAMMLLGVVIACTEVMNAEPPADFTGSGPAPRSWEALPA